jgi:hypothetical protein
VKQKKPGAAFWATVALVVVVVGYPLSFGPACWITSRTGYGVASIDSIYQPLMHSWWRGAEPSRDDLLHRYACFGAARFWFIDFDQSSGEYSWMMFRLG